MSIAREIAQYAHSIQFADLDKETINAAKRVIVDVMGCAIGASDERPVAIAREAVYAGSWGTATLLGTRQKTSPDIAAFVNGLAARYFDYNDGYENMEFAHPSDNILPLMAVAESSKRNGKDLILATVIAYEIQCRLCDAASLWRRGWDHVSYGLVSVSAAASRLMWLSTEQTEQAINIALSSHITLRQVRAGELSMWKAASFANAARNAVFSAMLAGKDMTGPSPIFEGEMGFWKEVSGKFKLNLRSFGNRRNRFRITQNILKYFPAEIRSQSAISAALSARKHFSSIDEISSVEIGTTESGYKILGKDPEKWDPKTKETADHSLPYIVAVALMDGRIDNNSYLRKRFREKKTLKFMKKISVKEKANLTAMYPRCIPNELTIRLRSGKSIREKVLYQKGHQKNPMSNQEIEEKFSKLTGKFLNKAQKQKILQNLWNLEKAKSMGSVIPDYRI
ncbi:MAG: MmgE/PrpD family protein [Candidatus Micrarchaeota archaeon]|nr:MmgE/PrpD family protein [Candidatus Micrarchaeota archaeon]MDE1864435.1 MmgE/PrpD family protein [Candidatus Micrarchaeota archaeon]